MRPLLVLLLASHASAQPLDEAERRKVLAEMRTCMLAADKKAAAADAAFTAGRYADAVRDYKAAMFCPGTVPIEHEKAKLTLAACHAGDAATAKQFYGTLLHAHRRGIDAVCAKHEITLRARAAPAAQIDADMAAETLEPVRGRLAVCVMRSIANPKSGFRASFRGETAANGTVTRVDVRGPWAECAEQILRSVRFPATKAGSTFAYDTFVDPSVLRPEKAIAHAERWEADGQPRDAVRQWVWIANGAQRPEHLERAIQVACAAKLHADATLLAWQLDVMAPAPHGHRCQRSP